MVTPNAETLDTLVGSLADDIGGGTLALTIRRLNRLSDEVVEAAILGTNGVLSAHVDLVSASILIKYNPEQTGPHRIRRYLNTLGVVTSRTSCEGRRVHITRAAPKHDKDEDSDEFSEVVRDEPAKHECAESDDSDAYIDRRGIVDENDSDEFTEVLSGGSAVVKSVEDALDLDTKIQNLEVELKKLLSEKKETARRKAYNTLLQIRQRNAESRSVPLRITPQAIPQYVFERHAPRCPSCLTRLVIQNPGIICIRWFLMATLVRQVLYLQCRCATPMSRMRRVARLSCTLQLEMQTGAHKSF